MRSLILDAASVAALALIGPASAEGPIVLKFSHVVASDTPKGKAADKFKELAEKYTDGKVKVEIYPNSTLYKDKEELEALQLGSVQLLAPSISKFGPLGVREYDVFDLPFLMSDDAHARQMTYAERQTWKKTLQAHRSTSLDAPPWMWTSIVDLVGAHEKAYLDHCRRFALDSGQAGA